jgi:hypothetical protein
MNQFRDYRETWVLIFQFILSYLGGQIILENSGNISIAVAAVRCPEENDASCGIEDFAVITIVFVGSEYQCLLDDEPTQAVGKENQWGFSLFILVSAVLVFNRSNENLISIAPSRGDITMKSYSGQSISTRWVLIPD